MEPLSLQISDIVISAVREETCPPFWVDASYQRFLVRDREPDVLLRVHYGEIPPQDLGELVFHSGGPWNLYRRQDKYLLTVASEVFGPRPFRLALFEGDFSRGDLYIKSGLPGLMPGKESAPSGVNPFQAPLDEMVMVNFLARRRLGLIFHACGLSDGGRGLLFAGVSGAGKSTLAGLWREAGGTLFSDERIVLRRKNGKFWLYGTPWYGDAQISRPDGAPLEEIFILRHASQHAARALTPGEATSSLLVRCFPPFYDRAGMAFILDFLAQVSTEVPCYELGFAPEADVVDFVRGLG